MILELTTFHIAPDVEDAAFLAADKRVQTELIPNQPGFLRRTTAERGGEWVVVTLWWSEEQAAAFAQAARSDPIQQEFEMLIEGASSTRFDTLD